VAWVLGSNHKERLGKWPRIPVNGNLPFFHGFQQSTLALWGCSVDFIRKNQLVKDWSLVKHKLAILLTEHRRTDNIGRRNVARELDAVVRKVEYLSKRMSQGGFPIPGISSISR
jgi:hypothetical protein